jgi:hypothetical protein
MAVVVHKGAAVVETDVTTSNSPIAGGNIETTSGLAVPPVPYAAARWGRRKAALAVCENTPINACPNSSRVV